MSISSAKHPLDWEDLRLFLAVARAEGLAGSARRTGISAPTLGRRMTELERRLDRQLFDRRQTGYGLTDAGRELYQQALEMELAAEGVERWRTRNARRIVRISAGAWTSRFLATHIDRFWRPGEPIGIELSTTHARVDIAHRQADIGLRNRAPDDARLAGRRLQDIANCAYRARTATLANDELPWIGVTGDAAMTASARWVRSQNLDGAVLICSDARAVVDMLHAGVGRAVLPCFIGDSDEALERIGDPIPELRGEQWLVLNEQARHEPAVRTVIDRLGALLTAHHALFVGQQPSRARLG
jgi:DNA-binding transcriptional LysR family regulator